MKSNEKVFNVRLILRDGKFYCGGFMHRIAEGKACSEWKDASKTDRKKLEEQLR